MERYSEYKDSGVQWLGEIPGHWGCLPLKRIITKIESGVSANGSTSQAASGNELGVLKTGCVSFRIFNPRQNKLVLGEECKRLTCPVKGNTIIVSRMNTPELVGSCAFVEKDYPNLFLPDRLWQVYFCDNASVKFLHWMLNSQFVRNRYAQICVGSSSTMQNISQSQFSETNIPLPPLSEQHSIVSYLDDKCGKIDKMLEGKQKQIELLAEMKQRIIADAVTHGLNPDVKMKATNIPWLPEIPKHWSCIKLKAFCKDNKEKNKGNVESCILSLSYGNVIVKQNVNFGLVPENYESYQIVKPGYIILRLTDLQNDHKSLRTGLVKHRGIITSAYVGLVVNNINNEYVHLLLHSYDVMKVFYGMGGGLRQSMSYQDISNLYMPVPPLSEQRAIVSYITDKTAKIDALTVKLQQEIESIKEYKQRLISDVVTGQIKVC